MYLVAVFLCQISLNYNHDRRKIPEELIPLISHFKLLLSSATSDKPLILFLDSLDQLAAANGIRDVIVVVYM